VANEDFPTGHKLGNANRCLLPERKYDSIPLAKTELFRNRFQVQLLSNGYFSSLTARILAPGYTELWALTSEQPVPIIYRFIFIVAQPVSCLFLPDAYPTKIYLQHSVCQLQLLHEFRYIWT
jgi:hypothetical protein